MGRETAGAAEEEAQFVRYIRHGGSGMKETFSYRDSEGHCRAKEKRQGSVGE